MLNIVTGRSGSGKSSYVNGILYNLAKSGNNKLLAIVPEQFSFASERSVLESLPITSAQNIEVLSFTRLADYVGRSLGGIAGTYADKGAEIIIMLRALEGLADNLEFYGAHIKSVALAKELITLIGEFKRECVTPEMLESASKKTDIHTFSMKLHELSLIYSAYDSLFENKFMSASSIPDRLCNTLSEHEFFKGYTIVIDAFKGFTLQELQILKYLFKQADNVYLTLCTEDIFTDDSSMIWCAINDTAKKIIRMSKENGTEVRILAPDKTTVKTGARFDSQELAFLERNIFLALPEAWDKEHEVKDIVLYTASDLRNECNFIAATVRKLIREDNIRLKEMAVIVRNESNYRRELTSAFVRFGIPVFEDTRQPIMNQPLISLCKSVLNIMITGFSTENVLGYLKTGLCGLDDLEIATLENYALMWGLSAKSWQNDFTLNPDGMNAGKDEGTDKKLAFLNELRRKIIIPLLTLKKEIRNNKDEDQVTAYDISTALYDFIIKTGVSRRLKELSISLNNDGYTSLAIMQNRIYEILMESLNKLASIYGDTPTNINTYYNLFCALISVTDLGSIPHGLDEITIGAADRIRLSSPKVVFVAGCAEGVFPQAVAGTGLLTSNDRRNLNDLGIELSLSNDLLASDERFIAYNALTSSKSKLYVSYHRTDGASESMLPSSIFTSIEELFGNDSIKKISAETLAEDYFAETEISTFSVIASNYKSKSTKVIGMSEALAKYEYYKYKIKALEHVNNKEPFKISNPEISTKLFGQDMFLSASRVDVYHHCAFEYFCKFGIKAKPREKAELSPAVAGTVIHYVLENIIKDLGKDGLLKLSTQERNLQVDKWLKIYLEEQVGGFDDKTLRFKYLYNRLSFSLYSVVARLCAEFEVSDFVPCDFELSIGAEDGIPSYSIDLEDGGKLEVFGSVDRVDKFIKDNKTYIRVVDYKSGGKDFVLSDILDGLNMQMLIYLFAIWAGGKERYGNVTPAGILYYPAKRATISMTSKNMGNAQVDKELDKSSRGNGLFLLNDDILEAMEHGKKGRFIKITDRYGKLLDNLITIENMALLKKKIDSVLSEMAQNLHSGFIPAYPVKGSRYEFTCEYCDYASVCKMSEESGHEIIKTDNATVYSVLNGNSSNGGEDNEHA